MRREHTSTAGPKRIGVTLGDPSGIGPEVVAGAITSLDDTLVSRLTLFGEAAILERSFEMLGKSPPQLDLCNVDTVGRETIRPGAPNSASAKAQVSYLEAAVAAAKAGEIDAIATAPIHKAHAASAGFRYPGHTEFLAACWNAEPIAMMFAGPRLRVVLTTTHVSLADVPATLSKKRIVDVTRLAVATLRRDFGADNPRVGVLGLNPHAGEGGQFGDEELRIIAPAIEELTDEFAGSAEIHGPLPADSAFRDHYDLFVAMYHDQGLIPVKLLDFESSVNLTLGLPIVRTSPDHGVAHDIAGRGVASARPMCAAIELAADILDTRARQEQR